MFISNDLELLLISGDAKKYGKFDQIGWTIVTGDDATDNISRVISLHEFLHNELNNSSIYGLILLGYAYLQREESLPKNNYKQILQLLVNKCRKVHEVYATYSSILSFQNGKTENFYTSILRDYPLYKEYYDLGSALVGDIDSIFFRQHAFSIIIRICFQSKLIGDSIIENLSTFDLENIDSEDYPNNRFDYLLKELPKGFIKNNIIVFFEEYNNPIGLELLKNVYHGLGDLKAVLAPENNKYTEDYMFYLYNALDIFLVNKNLISCPLNSHLEYAETLLPILDRLCPLEKSAYPLVLNKLALNYEKSLLQSFEHETFIFSSRPLRCIVLQPEETNDEIIKMLWDGIGEVPHLFIVSRDTRVLIDQYRFVNEIDKEWFVAHNGPFTAIRFASKVDGERTIFYIPFEDPRQLLFFLSGKNEFVPLVGNISMLAAENVKWWEKWNEFFVKNCHTSTLLLDISPLYSIENIFSVYEEIYYEKIVLKMVDNIRPALIFDIKSNGITNAFVLVPCSDLFCQAIHHYLKMQHPLKYKLELNLLEPHNIYLPIILSHIFTEEQKFEFIQSVNN